MVETGNSDTPAIKEEDADQWILYIDGASNENRSGTSMMLISPKGYKIHYALHFGFLASNNEVEYEAVIVGLRLAKELQCPQPKNL